MKKISIYMILVLQVLLGACNSRDTSVQPSPEVGAGKTIQFTLDGARVDLRSNTNEFEIKRLDLLICDQEQRILEKVEASLEPQIGSWRATINHAEEARTVHFVANYTEWKDWDAGKYIDKDVRLVLAGISTDKYTAWQQFNDLPNGITTHHPFGNKPIELVCNFAKFTLTVTNGLDNVSFAIYNYDKGTIAPFDPTGVRPEFKEDVITIPHDAQLIKTNLGDEDFKSKDSSVFTFESDNADSKALDGYSCMIIKGRYKGSEYYYKIALLGADGKTKINIKRNTSYQITIDRVLSKGHKSIAEALDAVPDNTNFTLEAAYEKFPSISDGKRHLSVDRTFVLCTDTHDVEIGASYEHNTASGWAKDNSLIRVESIGIEGFSPAVSSVGYDSASGKIQITPKTPQGGQVLKSKVRVRVEDNGKTVYRIINVQVRAPFVLEASAEPVKGKQGSPLLIRFTIPERFHKQLFPLELRFKTNNFYPDAKNPMRFTVDHGTPVYIYVVEQIGSQEVHFKSNIGASAEDITITAPYFSDKEVRVVNN